MNEIWHTSFSHRLIKCDDAGFKGLITWPVVMISREGVNIHHSDTDQSGVVKHYVTMSILILLAAFIATFIM